MNKHEHGCSCEHGDVAYCKKCDRAWCRGCEREWKGAPSDPWTWTVSPSSWPYTTGDPLPAPATWDTIQPAVCSHG